MKSKGLNLYRLLNLWLRMAFYSAAIYVIFALCGLTGFGFRGVVRSLMPVTRSLWWFASAYFVMYLLHPYINILLNALSREDYKKFLMAIFTYWSILSLLTRSSFQASYLTNFICLYSLAGCLRLWADDYGNTKFIWCGIGFILLKYILDIASNTFGFNINHHDNTEMLRPLTVASALCLFIGFKHLNVKHSKIINVIASAAFGVYLIHDNEFMMPFLWRETFKAASYQDSPYLIPYSIAAVMIVYVVCTVIELVRSKIFRVLSRGRLS